jgi:hypothetical protein
MKFIRHKAGIVGLVVLCISSYISTAAAQSTSNYEYHLKATFMYQFVNFIDGWKFEQEKDENGKNNENKEKTVLLGIIGKDPFGDAFKPLMEKPVRDRKFKIRRLEGFSKLKSQNEDVTVHPETDQIKKCDLIFVCSSEQQYTDKILGPLRNERILTIADMENFLEKGGIINFTIEKSKVRFEINVSGAKRANLTIRSKLLRLASKVIMNDELDDK